MTKTAFIDRLKEAKKAFQNVPGAFKLVWEADRPSAIQMGIITLLLAGVPAGQAWVAKLLIDGVVSSIHDGLDAHAGLRRIAPYLLLEFLILLVNTVFGQWRRLTEHVLDHRLGQHVVTRIMRKALSLSLYYFEDAEFYDKMQNARRQAEFRVLAIVNSSFSLLQNILVLGSFLVILLAFNPWIALALFGATIPSFIVQTRYGRLSFRLQTWRAPESRQMNYLEQVLTQDTAVKEVKLFGLGEPLIRRHEEIFWRVFKEDLKLARDRSVLSTGWGLASTLSYYGAYAWIIFLAVGRMITLGDLTLYHAVFSQSQSTFQGLLDNLSSLYENGLFMENLFSFLDLPEETMLFPAETKVSGASHRIGRVETIEFKDVSFKYPGRQELALSNVNLLIRAGEKIALVGENGAGKTTLVKLLAGLYEPTGGVILLNGVDLKKYGRDELFGKIGVIFQDFVKYQLSLRENIGFGSVEKLEDLPRIEEAAKKSGADEVARELPNGMETLLGRWFAEGSELSGGQWQKVALGRAFMRDGEILVLDEPTSSLDAEAEYELFQKFQELTEHKVAILVSHRFSTVRMADRIVVLKGGAVEELGSHEELVARRGTYARLFELQAQGYR